MNAYTKPKDRYFAALFVFAGFVCIPLTALWFLLVSIKSAIAEAFGDLRREFKGGPRATAAYAFRLGMTELAARRARRERKRKEAAMGSDAS
jgi:ethanolamine transporter EutH